MHFNPRELGTAADISEADRGHVLASDTPYSNLRAVTDLIRGSSRFIRWYEQHMGAKTLELLHGEVNGQSVSESHLLSGPANITEKTKGSPRKHTEGVMAISRTIRIPSFLGAVTLHHLPTAPVADAAVSRRAMTRIDRGPTGGRSPVPHRPMAG